MTSYKTQMFVNGQWMDAFKGGLFPTINPATNEVIAMVANGTSEDIDLAVQSAVACLHSPTWGYKSTSSQRAAILRKLGDILTERTNELAALDSLDMGKPMREALADLGDAVSCCKHFATLAEEQEEHQNEVIENGTGGSFVTTIIIEPLGVIGAITPWNYPLLMGIWKVIPAIAAGCTMVLKPSELAPLSCLLLGEMCFEAGLPAGALNVVPGYGADAGAPLSNHPLVDKVAFTGSVPTARRIMAAAALGPRAISLELGGKSPMIVFEDADINGTVDWMMTGILWGSGQVCSATSRVLIHSSIVSKVIERLLERLAVVKIGNSLSKEITEYEGPVMGPVVSEGQYNKILDYLKDAKEQGLTCIYGGDETQAKLRSDPATSTGFFIAPTIFINVPVTSRIWIEEIFGPVLCIREFTTEEEAVRIANDTNYGLAAAVMSADPIRCDRVTRDLRVGIVWKNCSQPAFIQAPWGGIKQSGFGRELGRWGLEEFSSVKQVTGCENGFSWELW